MQAMLINLSPTPPDAVMLAARLFAEDPRPHKVNLGIGMYYDEEGRIPQLAAVREADHRLRSRNRPWPYLPAEGLVDLKNKAMPVVFGEDQADDLRRRTAWIQTVGGTGAVRIGAELARAIAPDAMASISDPSWPNHEAIFRAVGARVSSYRYYDVESCNIDVDGMLQDLGRLPRGTVVVLHGCCHNPTGFDPTPAQWNHIAQVLADRGLIPFIDLAYQGFGEGLEADAQSVRIIAQSCNLIFVSVSFSKSFSLYGERVGLLFVVTESEAQAALVGERARAVSRALYSSAPSNRALLIAEVLGDPQLKTTWIDELDAMRRRILLMRAELVDQLAGGNRGANFAPIKAQRGLFSYSGLTRTEIERLRVDHAVHAVADGRICLAALNAGNLPSVAAAIRQVSSRH